MSRIAIPQLEAFYWVAELGSLQKAAARLNVTQSTVSLRLRQLQAELGTALIEPHGRGVRLNSAGQGFLGKVKPVLEAFSHLTRPNASSTISGTPRIGLAEGFAVACLAGLIAELAREYPLLHPEWTVTTSFALERSLIDGELDLAVVVDPMGDRTLRLRPLGLQPNVWAASPTLHLRAGASARELSRLTVITTPAPSSMYRKTVEWFAASGQTPGPLCVCTSVNAAAQLVGAGIGVGIFPAKMIEAFHSEGTVLPIATDPMLNAGQVYVADRRAGNQDQMNAVARTLERVTRELEYFSAAS